MANSVFFKSAVQAAVLAALLCSCQSTDFRAREKGALAGGALGAGLGAIIGNQTGSTGAGIAIGSAFGALSGALIGNEMDNQQAALDDRQGRIDEQDRALQENRRLIQELRNQGVDVRETRRGVVVNLPDVLFDFDRSALTPSARHTVQDIAQAIKDRGPRRISVEGHTDSVGTVPYNQRLSEDRARSVSHELVNNGIPRSNISTRGYGERDPIASNNSASGRQRNRRVEIVIENPR